MLGGLQLETQLREFHALEPQNPISYDAFCSEPKKGLQKDRTHNLSHRRPNKCNCWIYYFKHLLLHLHLYRERDRDRDLTCGRQQPPPKRGRPPTPHIPGATSGSASLSKLWRPKRMASASCGLGRRRKRPEEMYAEFISTYVHYMYITICINVCIYICMYAWKYTDMCTHLYIYICTYTHTYTHKYTYVCIHMHVHTHTYIYTHTPVYIDIQYTYTYLHIHKIVSACLSYLCIYTLLNFLPKRFKPVQFPCLLLGDSGVLTPHAASRHGRSIFWQC